MAVQDRVDDRQPRAVVAVGVSTELMLDLMRLKIRDLADLQHAVLCHGGRPRQLASGVVIFRIGQQNADVADDAAHDGLIDIIGEVVFIRLAEVGFIAWLSVSNAPEMTLQQSETLPPPTARIRST